MEQENEKLELVYGLEDKPSPLETAYAALQHLLAIIVGIITPVSYTHLTLPTNREV